MTASASLRIGDDGRARCAWVGADDVYRRYHDEEWGTALHGDRPLFEKVSLECFQAGLSWITILRKRPAFRAAFHGFTPHAVAAFDDADIERLMVDAGIVRNRAKIDATIGNARIVQQMIDDEPGSFDALMWSFAPEGNDGQRPDRPAPQTLADIPAVTPASEAMSKELRRRGFRFVGPTTMYALMQSAGMVDDHIVGCWRASSETRMR